MLTSLDHIVLVCADIDAGVEAYARVLGRGPDWRVEAQDGVATALFRVGNTALELMAPINDGAIGTRLKDILAGRDGVLTSLVFETDDIPAAHHTLTRRGLAPSDITAGESQDTVSKAMRRWSRFRLEDNVCAGIKTFVLEHAEGAMPPAAPAPDGVSALDHLVINTPNPTRAIAHYGGRLGLRFALDRIVEAFGTRFLFFRIGDLTLEVIQRLDKVQDVDNPDTLWGLTWKVEDLEAAHTRLEAAGLDISGIRKGRKPSTQVFTLRDGTLGIPTLFLSQSRHPH